MSSRYQSPSPLSSTGKSAFPQGRARLFRYLDTRSRWLAPVCAFGLVVPILSEGLAGSSNTVEWLVDLVSHWQWLFLVGLVFACTIAVFNDRRRALWLLALPLFWMTAAKPAPDDEYEKIPSANVLTVATFNVHMGNHDTTTLARWLAEAKPDVLVLHEVSPDYAKGLGALNDYRTRHTASPGLRSRRQFPQKRWIGWSSTTGSRKGKTHWNTVAASIVVAVTSTGRPANAIVTETTAADAPASRLPVPRNSLGLAIRKRQRTMPEFDQK